MPISCTNKNEKKSAKRCDLYRIYGVCVIQNRVLGDSVFISHFRAKKWGVVVVVAAVVIFSERDSLLKN